MPEWGSQNVEGRTCRCKLGLYESQRSKGYGNIQGLAGLKTKELGRRDADNGEGRSVYHNLRADSGGIMIESPCPIAVADHGDRACAASLICSRNGASNYGLDAQRCEITAGHGLRVGKLPFSVHLKINNTKGVKGDDAGESLILFLNEFEGRIRKGIDGLALLIHVYESEELLRSLHGQ